MDAGNGVGGSLGDCRPAVPNGPKYQMVKTQTESHIRRPVHSDAFLTISVKRQVFISVLKVEITK